MAYRESNGEWYKFNDTKVTKKSLKRVLFTSGKMATMLFYRHVSGMKIMACIYLTSTVTFYYL